MQNMNFVRTERTSVAPSYTDVNSLEWASAIRKFHEAISELEQFGDIKFTFYGAGDGGLKFKDIAKDSATGTTYVYLEQGW